MVDTNYQVWMDSHEICLIDQQYQGTVAYPFGDALYHYSYTVAVGRDNQKPISGQSNHLI